MVGIKKTLKSRNKIINKIKAKRTKRGMKYWILVPSIDQEAEEIDVANGNTFWADAIEK